MATGQENQAAADKKVEMGNPLPYSSPSQHPLQQEPIPQKEHVQQFVQLNPQRFVQQQQPYQPQTAGFSDISGGYVYNQPMPQQMSFEPGQMMSTQSTVIENQPQQVLMMVDNEAPYSWLCPAVVSCFLCCPLAIGATIAALNSQSWASQMKYDEARSSAYTARALTIASFFCGAVIYIVVVLSTRSL